MYTNNLVILHVRVDCVSMGCTWGPLLRNLINSCTNGSSKYQHRGEQRNISSEYILLTFYVIYFTLNILAKLLALLVSDIYTC